MHIMPITFIDKASQIKNKQIKNIYKTRQIVVYVKSAEKRA